MKTKICLRCKLPKPVDTGFYKSSEKKDGLYSHCTECHRESARQYEKSPKGRITMRDKTNRMIELYGEKVRARSKLRYAVKTGKIQKPLVCDNCGDTAKLQGHHPDYGKPLEADWLCDPCHKLKHSRLVDISLLKDSHV